MSRGLLAKVSRLLGRPLFGTFVVPKDARVDPTLFSEEDLPVYCPKCDYLLRGLPDGRCPECGTPFERGLLLVRQYVFEWGERPCRRTPRGKAERWWSIVAFALILFLGVTFGGLYVLHYTGIVDVANMPDWFQPVFHFLCLLAIPMCLAGAGSVVLSFIRVRRVARRRRMVIGAVRAAADADEHRSSP